MQRDGQTIKHDFNRYDLWRSDQMVKTDQGKIEEKETVTYTRTITNCRQDCPNCDHYYGSYNCDIMKWKDIEEEYGIPKWCPLRKKD